MTDAREEHGDRDAGEIIAASWAALDYLHTLLRDRAAAGRLEARVGNCRERRAQKWCPLFFEMPKSGAYKLVPTDVSLQNFCNLPKNVSGHRLMGTSFVTSNAHFGPLVSEGSFVRYKYEHHGEAEQPKHRLCAFLYAA